jgi:hypothetical protein
MWRSRKRAKRKVGRSLFGGKVGWLARAAVFEDIFEV